MQAFSCLMYHNVCANGSLAAADGEWAALSPSITSYFVEEDVFEAQIAEVQRQADVITLESATRFFHAPLKRLVESAQPDLRPSTLITFDDGWRGTLDLAVPVLRKYSVEATVFITTGLLDTPGFLRADELHQLPAQLQVGSHCKTHGFLNEMSDKQIREELRISKEELEQLTGKPVNTVAIPNGAVDDRVRRIALELGYELIFTSDIQLNSRWTGPVHIGRAAIRSTTTPELASQYAEGNFGFEPIRRMVLSLPKRVLGPQRYRQLRAWWFGEKSTQREMHDLCVSGPATPTNLASPMPVPQNMAAEATLPY